MKEPKGSGGETTHLSPVPLRSYREMNPVYALTAPFYQQFVEVLTALVADVEEKGSIADGLFQDETGDWFLFQVPVSPAFLHRNIYF